MNRLLQINSVVNVGSTGRIVEDIGQIAMANGWDSYIAYGRNNNNNSKSNLIKIGSDFDIKIHGLYTRIFDRHCFASENATLELIKNIEKIKPNIIHLHNIHGYYINIKILFDYLKKINTPIFWTMHDCWSFTGHCCYFSYIKCDKWKTHCESCPQRNKYPASIFYDNSKRNFIDKKNIFNSISNLTLVPVSYWLENLLKESFLKKYPICTIHNGINVDEFNPKNTDLISKKYNLNNKFVILGVANVWENRKGFADFNKLAEILNEEHCIVLVGLDDSKVKKIHKNIIGIKRTENISELASLYSVADVFFNPTLEDNFPTTNIESLACGTPVITYNTGGSIEAINNENGFIIEQGDIAGCIEIINKIKVLGKIYFQEACIRSAVNNFNKFNKYINYIQLYNRKLN